MSEVWLLHADVENFATISPVDPSTWELLNSFDGHRFEGDWPRPKLERLPTGPPGDFAYLASHVVALTARAWGVLRPKVGEAVQALPLDVQGDEYQALNVLDVLDCLDPELAELRTVEPSGRVVGVRRWALREDVVQGPDIFKARAAELQAVLVSEQFRDWVQGAGLQGATFDPISDADDEAI